MEDQRFSSQNSDLNKDLALRIDNNDTNQMTFAGHIVYLCPSEHNLHPRSARAQTMLLGPQVNYTPSNNHVIVLLSRALCSLVVLGRLDSSALVR